MDTGSDSDPHDRSGAGHRPDHGDRPNAPGDRSSAGRSGSGSGSGDGHTGVSGLPALPAYPGYPPALGEARYLTDEELQRSLDRTLACQDAAADLWLFGYGSLIWNPGM